MSTESHWYCVRTKPRTERITSRILRTEAGVEVFSPLIRFERARRTGRVWVTEAMFPGYVFARFDYLIQNRQIRASRGVVTIVTFGDQPCIVAPEIVEDLRRNVRDEETITVEPSVAVGEEVNVIEGPFRGLRAVVSRIMPAKERVALLLEVLGMEREIEISSTMILPDLAHPMSKPQE